MRTLLNDYGALINSLSLSLMLGNLCVQICMHRIACTAFINAVYICVLWSFYLKHKFRKPAPRACPLSVHSTPQAHKTRFECVLFFGFGCLCSRFARVRDREMRFTCVVFAHIRTCHMYLRLCSSGRARTNAECTGVYDKISLHFFFFFIPWRVPPAHIYLRTHKKRAIPRDTRNLRRDAHNVRTRLEYERARLSRRMREMPRDRARGLCCVDANHTRAYIRMYTMHGF